MEKKLGQQERILLKRLSDEEIQEWISARLGPQNLFSLQFAYDLCEFQVNRNNHDLEKHGKSRKSTEQTAKNRN